MDLRNLPDGLTSQECIDTRCTRIEEAVSIGLSAVRSDGNKIGDANERNCENMFGHVPIPVGYAGPLFLNLSSNEKIEAHLPLATTEGALVASMNRGCKAIRESDGVNTTSTYHGTTRSIAFKVAGDVDACVRVINDQAETWKKVGEETSNHLQIKKTTIDEEGKHIFLTLYCDCSEAMGMNMVTIAAQAIGNWITEKVSGIELITVAGNVDSDKKPSKRTRDEGRGYEVRSEITMSKEIIESVFKTTPEQMFAVAEAKLEKGSHIAGALGTNLHAANIIAALYLATGQDAAHVVEGSLTETSVKLSNANLTIAVRCPALLLGIRGGGTGLPAQKQCLDLLLKAETILHPCQQLAETIGAAVLAGEISLLAAQATQDLATSHQILGR